MSSATQRKMQEHPGDDGAVEPAESRSKTISSGSVQEKILSVGNFYLHIDPKWKMIYYVWLVVVMSWMGESAQVPHLNLLTGKRSVLNQVFVKLGWAWTLSVWIVYHVVSLPLHADWPKKLKTLIVRLAVTTLFFYIFCTVTFPTLESFTGHCIHKGIAFDLKKKACLKLDNHEYYSFDISGHSFLLTYCVLILMTESREVLHLLKLNRLFHSDDAGANNLSRVYRYLAPLSVVAYVMLALFTLLWDFMLIITTIYYHTFAEKLIGTLLSLSVYYVLYNRIFKYLNDLL